MRASKHRQQQTTECYRPAGGLSNRLAVWNEDGSSCPPGAVDRAGSGLYNGDQLEFNFTVSVAQLVERRTVAPVVEGSSPSTHPILCKAR